jgi:hypothetical protein
VVGCSVFVVGFIAGFGFVAGLTAEGNAEVCGGALCDGTVCVGAVRGVGSVDAGGNCEDGSGDLFSVGAPSSTCFVEVQPKNTTNAAHPIIVIAFRIHCNLMITSPPE